MRNMVATPCRYNEIAELVVAAAQRRALQQRAVRQGVMLVPGAVESAVVKVGGRIDWWLDRCVTVCCYRSNCSYR